MAFISNGTTILDNGAFDVSLGNLVLISEQTASASASISFTSGIDSTYPIYKFEFINIHQATDVAYLSFQGSTNAGSSYGVTITSTFFYTSHDEADTSTQLAYWTSRDLAQSTSFQPLGEDAGNDNDQNYTGSLYLFNPSSTTYVKHFIGDVQSTNRSDYSTRAFASGYFNTTTAIDAIQFKMNSGNIDSGTIKLYGIKDS